MGNEYELKSGDKLVIITPKDEDGIPEETLLVQGWSGSRTIEIKQGKSEVIFPIEGLKQLIKALNVISSAIKENV